MASTNNILKFARVGDDTASATPAAALPSLNANRIILGLLPFTPVAFSGPDAIFAWGRLGVYSLIAYWTYNKIRPVAYAAMGAAGVSLATSLTYGLWNKS